MARERYLVGVTKEELEYTPAPQAPMTPQGWFENLWYHYKWAIVGGAFAVAVLVVLLWQTFSKDNPDYRLCMACGSYLPDAVVQELETQLEEYGKDLNGDGKVEVTIQMLDVNSKGVVGNGTVAANNRQAVVVQLSTRDTVLFAFDPVYYQSLCDNLAKGTPLLDPLSCADPSGDGTYFTWDVKAQLPDELKEYACDPLYVGVRSTAGDLTPEERERTAQAKALLEAYAASLTEPTP